MAPGAGLFDGCALGPSAAQRLVARTVELQMVGEMDRA